MSGVPGPVSCATQDDNFNEVKIMTNDEREARLIRVANAVERLAESTRCCSSIRSSPGSWSGGSRWDRLETDSILKRLS